MDYTHCRLCPRMCGADRRASRGFCSCGTTVKLARAALHHWEEPCISGNQGSGAIFFSGCTLRCCYCQNYGVSHENFGREITERQLADIFLRLQDQGAHNINLVTATMYLPSVIHALDLVRHRLNIPVIYNSGGYEREEIIKKLDGYVDIWLPDLKYFDCALSELYSGAGNYFEAASVAVRQMIRQTGAPVYSEETERGRSLLLSGTIIRHLVLPGKKEDSIRLLRWISNDLPRGQYLISLLSQYTPRDSDGKHPEIGRRVTTYEYQRVVDEAILLGLTDGYTQRRTSAKKEYTPPFNLEGVY